MIRQLTRPGLVGAGLVLTLAACGGTTNTVSTASGSASSGSASTTSSQSSSSSPSSSTSTATADTPTVKSAVQQMDANFTKAKSAHVVAQQVDGSTTIKIELSGTVDGSNQQGTITNNSASDGGTVQFVVADGKEYVKGDAAYYKSSGNSAGAKNAGKWVMVPTSSSKEFGDLTLKSLFGEMKANFADAKTTAMKLTTITENGQPAWQIADKTTTGVIAADGSARLLRAEHTESGKIEKYVFDQWDAAPTVTAPSGAIQG